MATLTKDQLLAAAASPSLPQETLHIPELGGDVLVRGMSGKQRDEWEASLIKGRGDKRRIDTSNARARLAVRCLVDDKGQRLFTDLDAELLGNLPASVLQRIFNVAQKLSGVSDEDIDELGKSSAGTDGSGSPTS